VRVIALSGAPGICFHIQEIARLLFTFETTKVARPNQLLLYFFWHDELAPGYGRTVKAVAITLFSSLTEVSRDSLLTILAPSGRYDRRYTRTKPWATLGLPP